MKILSISATVFLLISFLKGHSQPFIDIVNYNFQTFSGNYKANPTIKNTTNNQFLNLFIPKKINENDILLLRLNSEKIKSTIHSNPDTSSNLYGIGLSIGIQHEQKNKKWKWSAMIIPKLAGDLTTAIYAGNFQLGGLFLFNYRRTDNLRLKIGLYYNKEAFGHFFIPVAGVDWKINKRWYMYGSLPSLYRIEFAIIPNKLYSGAGFRSFTRSFRLSSSQQKDFVRYDEMQAKVFIEYYIYHKIVCFGELGYTLGKNPLQYKFGYRKEQVYYRTVYTGMNSYNIINLGLAYRIRQEVEKSR